MKGHEDLTSPPPLHPSGSDGRDYTFLVKGHEDLRQDERVMQLFGLVNTLLKTAPETMRRNLPSSGSPWCL